MNSDDHTCEHYDRMNTQMNIQIISTF